MIEISRDGKSIKILADSGVTVDGCNGKFEFSHGLESEIIAEIVVLRFQEQLNQRIEARCKECYDQGWKDAKSHNAKKATMFEGVLELGYHRSGCYSL